MKRQRARGVLYTPGFSMNEIEFYDDERAIAKELAAFDEKARAKAAELGRIIAEDFERERQQLLAEALRKQAEYRLDLKLMELDEKMRSAIEADRAEARRVFTAYAERLQKAFHVTAEDQAKWLA